MDRSSIEISIPTMDGPYRDLDADGPDRGRRCAPFGGG
jgi:hypothetical protein